MKKTNKIPRHKGKHLRHVVVTKRTVWALDKEEPGVLQKVEETKDVQEYYG